MKMPFVKVINKKIYEWNLESDIEKFHSIPEISNNIFIKDNIFTNNKRLIEKYNLIALLNFIKPQAKLDYSNNKPLLKNVEKNISISHSANKLFVMIVNNNEICGIDYHIFTSKTINVKNKVFNKNEIELANQSKNFYKIYNILWASKETVYKAFNNKNLYSFINTIFIDKITNKYVFGYINLDDKKLYFRLKIILKKNSVLCYFDKLL